MRAFPSSKRHPQFSRQPLAASLESFGIAYDWQGGALGGFRKGGYAEQRAERICIMCAESDPANCHRLLIAEWLVAHGHKVVHLLAEGRMREHALHPQEDLWRDV